MPFDRDEPYISSSGGQPWAAARPARVASGRSSIVKKKNPDCNRRASSEKECG
jgi:hypothetical protein